MRDERLIVASILGTVGLFTIFDVYEDLLEGVSLTHVIAECLIIFITLTVALYLLHKEVSKRKRAITASREELEKLKTAAEHWRQTAENLSHGVTDAISKQFNLWGLSKAEQDVAFLLLKGLSLCEIAGAREVSERTIKQQASVIYHKSGLSGRSQLSAFFLEDLFDSGSRQ